MGRQLSRLGIYCHGFMEWGGGIDFVRIIAQSLLVARPNLDLHLILPDSGVGAWVRYAKGTAQNFLNKTIRKRDTDVLVYGTSESLFRRTLGEYEHRVNFHHISRNKDALARLSRRLYLDAIALSFGSLGEEFPIPWVGYIYDFQHRSLPQYFKEQEVRRRDADFDRMLNTADAVVVNSLSVADDAKRYYPNGTATIFALPVAAAPETNWLIDHSESTLKYGIASPYFLISNQFFIHKRHDVAFEAFQRVLQADSNLALVCTGNTYDGRWPKYFDSLLSQLDRLGIRGQVKILGMIPKLDQIELMKNALAVIQPTLFEGGPGGGSVYDAVSVGTPTIVSDIPVNREMPQVWRFVRPGDPGDLANAMMEIAMNPLSRPSDNTLLSQGLARRRSCGVAMLAAVEFATEQCRS